jgi:hypothetical protein
VGTAARGSATSVRTDLQHCAHNFAYFAFRISLSLATVEDLAMGPLYR